MTILKDVLSELFGMFVADARLTAAILTIVAISAAIAFAGAPQIIAGAVLLTGCLGVLIGAVLIAARERSN
ncbi:MAG: hypothetical protein H6883_14355 [Rhodobiaceae bacterium]|nr:hypothetical protein [Rhodobiaceae bacterium]MCC0057299.1 hypothetical protein [Rhodobiaceae bacterium]